MTFGTTTGVAGVWAGSVSVAGLATEPVGALSEATSM